MTVLIDKQELVERLEKSITDIKLLATTSWQAGYYTAIEDVIYGIKNTEGVVKIATGGFISESACNEHHVILINREYWLNGCSREGATVLVGTGVHCAGCGKFFGSTCVVTDCASKEPDYPFYEIDCPVCTDVDYSADILSKISLADIRKEIQRRKKYE